MIEIKKRGTMQDELEWSQANRGCPEADNFLNVAEMYRRHADHPTYGLLLAVRDNVRKAMGKNINDEG